MKKTLLIVVLGTLVSASHVAAQSKRGPLEGVWQTVEVTLTGPGAPLNQSMTQPHLTRRTWPGHLAAAAGAPFQPRWPFFSWPRLRLALWSY